MWYYSKNGAQQGPIGPAEMQSKLRAGEIAPVDLVWREGMADWVPAEKVAELQELIAPPPVVEPVDVSTPVSPYAPPQARPGAPVVVVQHSSGLATASMVCGIVSLLTCCLWCLGGPVALAAVILGHVAKSKAKADPARFGGQRMATAGLITGYLGLLASIAMLIFGLWAQTQSPDDIRNWNFLPPEAREQFIRQMESQKQLRPAAE